jgi:hypothetical protein
MPKNKSTVLDVVSATLDKITNVSLPKRKFIFHIFELWISMNCRYVFKGRKKLYDGKVDIGNIDKRRLPKIYEDDKVKIYGGCVYCVQL